MDPIHLTIRVLDAHNTYTARAVRSINASTANLDGVRACCTAGPHQAISALLAKASPALRATEIKFACEDTESRADIYYVIAVLDT